ncbi:class I SAM-dependent methyltransferase [Flavobacterium ardleyense]|uniref:class I SAM-dependent methyltransferase n=1 Tax=Flavobacterium ardleyense TaxID=2038737 RepID=UPI00298C57B5|nr:class I SAM-dependent methyltransferase [Flavobacterium ardleyense]
MSEFWEESFKEKQEMWGFEPSKSTVITNEIFLKNGIKDILVLGIGYGRNAQLFITNKMKVTGIEISETAISLAHKHLGNGIIIHHGSITEMPYDDETYDGIYCYAVLHFLDYDERQKLLQDCYNQLENNGKMVFATISKSAEMYGRGRVVSTNRFEIFDGLKMFFYDLDTIQKEFALFGLIEIKEVDDIFPFFLIQCQKVKM